MDLHLLPKTRDGLSYLYVEHCRVDQEDKAIALHDAAGKTPVPCAGLGLLLLGPGTTVTHAAIRALAENGCLIVWAGEEGVRLYAQGMGETRSARPLLRQVRLWANPATHYEVVVRMYRRRFPEGLPAGLDLRQIRGREGIRVREAYARASRATGVPWRGRVVVRGQWGAGDPVNRALSTANSCLYGVCHAAIVAAGYSPALGFVHTGKQLSFVYDVADLYKVDVTIPAAFGAAAAGGEGLETRVRRLCRDTFKEHRLLARVVDDIQALLDLPLPEAGADGPAGAGAGPDREADYDSDAAAPGGLWDPEVGAVPGGINWGDRASDDPAAPPEAGDDDAGWGAGKGVAREERPKPDGPPY